MKTIRLLTIGNSFADNALTFLEDLAAGSGSVRFELGRANLGGCSLEKHSNLADYTARCPEHKTYRLGTAPDGSPREANLQDALAAESWDHITLQQVSAKSWRPETFQPHLDRLHSLVRRLAPQAAVWLHQTWAYRTDSPFLPEHGLTQELMFERIHSAVRLHAGHLGCRILPSGEAVQLARRTTGRTFSWPDLDFDYVHATAPALPRQAHSLSAGWRWAINKTPDGIPAMELDANHLNTQGCYLTGCVWFECLTGLDATALTFAPPGLEPETAAFLRAKAHAAIHMPRE